MELSQQKKMLEETNIALKVLLEHRSRNFVEIIESRLTEIAAPFLNRLTDTHRILTPREIDVAAWCGKEGRARRLLNCLMFP